jgi:hypothetical protein
MGQLVSDQRSDTRAELALLAACLTSKVARTEASRHILSGDFDDPRHEAIWDAMEILDRHSKSVDAVTVLATVGAGSAAGHLLPELVTSVALPDNVAEYAAIVRGWAVRRHIWRAATQTQADAFAASVPAATLATKTAARFNAIRDGHAASDDTTALTVAELLAEKDDEPDWLIPGLLERRDRLMLTGEEGLGKSHLLRQIAVSGSAGLSPFAERGRIKPIRSLIVDCENTWSQVRRKLRGAVDYAATVGDNPADRMLIDCTSRMDITRDRDLGRIHQLLDAWQPDLVVIGPLYRLVPRALQTDDDTAPVLAALDTIRDHGCALLMEAHAGHAMGKGGTRDLRPRGSSSLLGWPEFGYGMKSIGTEGYCDLVPWRGNREERNWPQRMRKANGFRWMPHDNLYGYGEPA